MYFKKQKKANAVLDTMIIFVVLFAAGIGLVFIYSGIDPVQQDLVNDFNESGDNWSMDFMVKQNENYPSFWDSAIIFIFLGMWLAAIISGFLLDTYPAFFIIVVIIMVPVLIVGITLSNIYDDLMLEDDILEYKAVFPMSYFLITNFLTIGIILLFSIAGAIYAKNKLG